jgi:hypothetical protein
MYDEKANHSRQPRIFPVGTYPMMSSQTLQRLAVVAEAIFFGVMPTRFAPQWSVRIFRIQRRTLFCELVR